jgi:hypothetical protein
VIFGAGYIYARRQGPVEDLDVDEETAGLLGVEKSE